jgi:hypothetical protein
MLWGVDMWRCDLSAIVYWKADPETALLTGWQVDEHGMPTLESAQMPWPAVMGGAMTAYYSCRHCGRQFGIWAEVEEHLASDWHLDGARSRWEQEHRDDRW